MGGSAGGSNAQLFSLMSQYGDGAETERKFNPAQSFQKYFEQQAKGLRDNSRQGPNMWGLFNAISGPGGRGGGGMGRPGDKYKPVAPVAPPQGQPFSWEFPQYTQTWAFTPPEPTPYINPPPFNKKALEDPLKKKKK